MNVLSEFVGASVSPELKKRLAKAARNLDLSMAQIVRRALAFYLTKLEAEETNEPNKS